MTLLKSWNVPLRIYEFSARSRYADDSELRSFQHNNAIALRVFFVASRLKLSWITKVTPQGENLCWKLFSLAQKRASSLTRSLEDFLLSISWSCNAGKTFPSCKKKKKTQTREEKFGVNLLPAVCVRARRSKLNPQLRADGSWIGRERERK